MLLKSLKGMVGALNCYTNTYIVYDEKTFEGVLIDIADNVHEIQEYVEKMNINLKYLVLTHCHADHIAGLKEFKRKYQNVRILIHELDASGLVRDEINLAHYLETESNFIEADRTLKDGDVIEIKNMNLKVIHTPGHTKGSVSILVEDALFSGDTLFKDSYGRVDFPTGSMIDMKNSIKKLLKLPDEIIVYPGHEEITKIGEAKKKQVFTQ